MSGGPGLRLGVLVAVLAGLALGAQPAPAAIFTVDSGGDSTDANIGNGTCADSVNACTLRAAIQEANFDGTADTVQFNAAVTAVALTLHTADFEDAAAEGDLDITNPVTIDGAPTTVTQNGNDRVFEVFGGSPTFEDLTVTGGSPPIGWAIEGTGIRAHASMNLLRTTVTQNSGHGGAGIYVSGGTTTLTDSFVTNNTPCSSCAGNGIWLNVTGGTLDLTGTTVSGNTASGTLGGGIHSNGTVTLTDSEVSGNTSLAGGARGAGIRNNGGTLTVDGSTISGNGPIAGVLFSGEGARGAGIANDNGGTLDMTDSTVTGNEVGTGDTSFWNSATFIGGGIWNNGTATITDSTISANEVDDAGGGTIGGGIYNEAGRELTLTRSTVSGNTVAEPGSGGGIFNKGTTSALGEVTISNSTISTNTAPATGTPGGGIYNQGTLDISHSTLADNAAHGAGDGVFHEPVTAGMTDSSVTLKDSILDNSAADNCSGAFTSNGHNLDTGTSCGLVHGTAGDLENTDPQLGALANNGGPTFTHALPAGSPALGAGDPSCPPPATDQRGTTRAQGLRCDVGAFERQTSDNTAPTTTDDVPTWHNGAFAVTLTAADGSGEGVDKTYYETGTSPPDPTTSSSVYNPLARPTLQDGEKIKYFSRDSAGNVESVKTSGALMVETTAPTDPSLTSPSHTTGVASNDNTVHVNFNGASDSGGSGLDGFSYLWDTAPTTTPDTTKEVEEGAVGTTSPALADGSSHYFHLRTRDNAGNWTSTVHMGPFVIDTTAPAAPQITDTDPDSPANDNDPEVKGSAEAGSTVTVFAGGACSGAPMATGSASAFASPGLTVNVPDNSTTMLRAVATDAVTNVSACSDPLGYVEDSSPPGATGDTIAPETTITNGPKKKSRKRSAKFEFESSEQGSSFHCRLDGAEFAACTSPHRIRVSRGKHTFEVRATDAAGNADPTPAAQGFKVKKP